ncbi:MAG TPA: GNAT family N-acetyltransferase [Acidimicrobiia bacterium]|nr:GNAT family N-acetyltransferase [Acidimicrobiia bacterium]
MEPARPATPADLPVLVGLARDLRDEMRGQRGGALWATREARAEPHDDTLAALLGRSDASIVVGTIDGSIVGFGTVEIETLRDGSRLGVIGDLFVEPEARSVGVGESIADEIIAFCATADCVGIDAYALPGARAAKNFFERSGFTARALVMHHKL